MNYFIVQGELDDLIEVAKSQSGPTGMVAPAVVIVDAGGGTARFTGKPVRDYIIGGWWHR